MRTRLTITLGSILAATALMLGVSPEPASAAPKSCLTMYSGYLQATLSSTHAQTTFLSFEDNAHPYTTNLGEQRVNGWYYSLAGTVHYYDLDPAGWAYEDNLNYQRMLLTSDAAQDASDAYFSNCGW
jgi:hypothetical protein